MIKKIESKVWLISAQAVYYSDRKTDFNVEAQEVNSKFSIKCTGNNYQRVFKKMIEELLHREGM